MLFIFHVLSWRMSESVGFIENGPWHKKLVKPVSYKWSVSHKVINKNEEKYSAAKAVNSQHTKCDSESKKSIPAVSTFNILSTQHTYIGLWVMGKESC